MQPLAVRPAYDGAILIGAVNFYVPFLQTLNNFICRMSEAVVPTDADDGKARLGGGKEVLCRRSLRAVMRDLQDSALRILPRREHSLLLLRDEIAREEERRRAIAHADDVRVLIARRTIRCAALHLRRVEDIDRHAVKIDMLARIRRS